VVSHDLKAPLRAIAQYASYLEEDLGERLQGDTRVYLERLKNRVERLQSMVGAVLEYARAGRDRGPPEPIRLSELVAEIVDLLGAPPGAKVEVEPRDAGVMAERAPLEQVLRNLIDNAIKHARGPEVRVRVSVSEAAGAYAFEVRDDGPGIPPDAHERIWSLFHTLEGEEKSAGTGIGLAVVKKLVDGRGGQVWVVSNPGEGAAFHFVWPR
jgi:signal transduction histidine kinase